VTHAMLPLLRRSAAGRIVNVSSPLGSLQWRANRQNPAPQPGLLAYNSSKAALNALTLHYANELRGTGILVNAANPGKVATDLNRHTGERTVSQGAAIVVRLATLDALGPTGQFLGDDGPMPW
ncbi:MAG: SDR family NAD(P)-dependent oxidoreductase, partial [Steroidobacteraceae bacterium]